MKGFSVRELKSTDTQALLTFEIHNREWFEAHIDARDPGFFSWQGVAEHIEQYLSDFALGVWHPLVIEDASGRIVGRANLKDINVLTRSAQVGYRVAQDACGQGLATLALRHLIEQARQRWELTQLVAYIYKENTGSRAVLDRCGFVPQQSSSNDNAGHTCRFVLSLANGHG